jgi:hypothetical protein
MVPVPKSYHGCFLQEGRDDSNYYDPNSGRIPVRRKYRNHRCPEFKIIDYIDDPKRASTFKNYGQAETVVAPSSIKPPPQRTVVSHPKAPLSRKFPTKNKNRTPVLSVSKISNRHLEVLLKEYATIQAELKLHHHYIDVSTHSISQSLCKSLRLLSTQKLLEFEISRLSPYWHSREHTIYHRLVSEHPKAFYDDPIADCPRDENTLDRLCKLHLLNGYGVHLIIPLVDYLICFVWR